MKKRAQLIAELYTPLKIFPDIAAKIVDPPPAGSMTYKAAEKLVRKIKALTPERNTVLKDPFDSLLKAIYQLAASFEPVQNPMNPNDQVVQTSLLLTRISAAICPHCEPILVPVSPATGPDCVFAGPWSPYERESRVVGYNVDVGEIDAARSNLERLRNEGASTDIRREVAAVAATMVYVHLLPVGLAITGKPGPANMYFPLERNEADAQAPLPE